MVRGLFASACLKDDNPLLAAIGARHGHHGHWSRAPAQTPRARRWQSSQRLAALVLATNHTARRASTINPGVFASRPCSLNFEFEVCNVVRYIGAL